MPRASRRRFFLNNLVAKLNRVGLGLWLFAGFTFEFGAATQTFWRHPAWSIGAMVLSAAVSQLVTMIPAFIHQIGKINAAIGVMLGNPHMEAREFAVTDFIGGARPADALGGRGLRFQSAQRLAAIRCFVLKKRDPSSSMLAMPFSINFNGGSFIFLGDTPNQLAVRPRAGAMIRFKVLHEIGHASAVTMQGEMIRVIGSTPILVIMALVAINSSLVPGTLVTELVLTALFLGTHRGAWDRHRSTILRDTEIAADLFALQTLPREDFAIVASAVDRIQFNDTTLSAAENFERNLYLRENAKNMRSGRVTVLAPPTVNRAPPFIVLLVITCFIMGAVSEPNPELTTFVMGGALVLLSIVMLVFIIGAKMQTDALDATLQPKDTESGSLDQHEAKP